MLREQTQRTQSISPDPFSVFTNYNRTRYGLNPALIQAAGLQQEEQRRTAPKSNTIGDDTIKDATGSGVQAELPSPQEAMQQP